MYKAPNVMKNLISLCLVLMLIHPSMAQKTETYVSLNSGLFSFQGVSATETSQLNLYSDQLGSTNNPFGGQKGLSAGVAYHMQRISKGRVITGVGIGYEILRSKLALDAVNRYDGRANVRLEASGYTNLSSHFINGFPYVGYRLLTTPVSLDLAAGFDVGYILKAYESGQATGSDGIKYSSFSDRTGNRFDVRPRVQVSATYAQIGVYAGYAYGLINYKKGWVGGQNQCTSEIIRFGLLYKLRG